MARLTEIHRQHTLELQTCSAGSRPQPIQVVVAACKSIIRLNGNIALAPYLSCLCVAC
jgi:hypothetical protein